ncbi:MAG: hypothetical protein JRH14_06570 [Deltaproteobacteria bacterium]|nr:hypothetical protein [Deltaproteobacteria bacterium]
MIIRESVKVGDKEITIETGRIAKQASGSVLVSSGETMVLVTVVETGAISPTCSQWWAPRRPFTSARFPGQDPSLVSVSRASTAS